jgi:transcriptional regulator with XRE-family HTH domain
VADEPEATAAERRALGAELAAYRRATGHTQAVLAQLTEYSRSTIANVETGRQHVPRDFWERADTALRTGGTLAGASDELEAAARRGLRAAARAASTARRARSEQDPGSPAGLPAAAGALDAAMQPGVTAGPLWLAALETPMPAGTGPPGLTQPPVPSRTGTPAAGAGQERHAGPGDLARLRGMRQQLKAIDNAHGGGAALPMAAWYLRCEILPLLNGRRGDLASRALADVAAEFQHDVGWDAYDAGQQQLATGYFTSALRTAHAAGNRLLGARILAAMSHQAIHLGHLRQAIDFAQAARSASRQIATPRTVAMLAAMEACAHAAAGDALSSERALDEAAAALTRITTGQAEPGWLDFDEGGYWGHAARAYRDLAQPGKSGHCAQKSVGLCLPGHSRTRAQRTAIQATAHLRMGEIDAAAAAAAQVVREAWHLHSGLVFADVTQLAAAIARSGAPEASDFLGQARELLDARGPQPGSAPG